MPPKDGRSNRFRRPDPYYDESKSEEDAADAGDDPSKHDADKDKHGQDGHDARRDPDDDPVHKFSVNRNERLVEGPADRQYHQYPANRLSSHPVNRLPQRPARPPAVPPPADRRPSERPPVRPGNPQAFTSPVDRTVSSTAVNAPAGDDHLHGFSLAAKVLLDKNVVTETFLEQSATYLRHNPRLVREEDVSIWRERARFALRAGDAELARKLIQQAYLIELSQTYKADGVDKFLRQDNAFKSFIKGSYTTFLMFLNRIEDQGELRGSRREMLLPWARFLYWAFREEILDTLSLPPDSISADWAADASVESKALQPSLRTIPQHSPRNSTVSGRSSVPKYYGAGSQAEPLEKRVPVRQKPGNLTSPPTYPTQPRGRNPQTTSYPGERPVSPDRDRRRERIIADDDDVKPVKRFSKPYSSGPEHDMPRRRKPEEHTDYEDDDDDDTDDRKPSTARSKVTTARQDDDDDDERRRPSVRSRGTKGRQNDEEDQDDDDTDDHFEDAQSKISDDPATGYVHRKGSPPPYSIPRHVPKPQKQAEDPRRPGTTRRDRDQTSDTSRPSPAAAAPANPITRLSRLLIGFVGQKTYRDCLEYYEDNPKIAKEDLSLFQPVALDLLRQGRREAAERVVERWLMLREALNQASSSHINPLEWMRRLPAVPSRQEALIRQRDTGLKALEEKIDTSTSSSSNSATSDGRSSTTGTQRAPTQPTMQSTRRPPPEVTKKPTKHLR